MIDEMQLWTAAMRQERYEAAWNLSEQWLRERDPATRDDPALPYHQRWVWDGRPLADRVVLVRCYHGLGDTIQFARFLPHLAQVARSLTVEVQPALARLVGALVPDAHIAPFDPARPLPPAECDIEIGELAFALRLSPRNVAPPYLHGAAADLTPGTIGLCHTASGWDAARSLTPAMLAPICDAAPCITLVPEPSPLPVRNPEGCSLDIDATSRLVAGCSLVVTVDTMVAHLAGALGRPVWLLLKAEPDWRWNPDRPTSAWYPATRLFVQQRAGDWAGVIDRVRAELADQPPGALSSALAG